MVRPHRHEAAGRIGRQRYVTDLIVLADRELPSDRSAAGTVTAPVDVVHIAARVDRVEATVGDDDVAVARRDHRGVVRRTSNGEFAAESRTGAVVSPRRNSGPVVPNHPDVA